MVDVYIILQDGVLKGTLRRYIQGSWRWIVGALMGSVGVVG
jgi:hypothetical protein